MSAVDWSGLLWETRGFLGLDPEGTEPVPVDELVATAEANGYDEREVREAIRDTDSLEAVGDLDDLRVRLADEAGEDTDVSGETASENPEEPVSPGNTPTPEAEETGTQSDVSGSTDPGPSYRELYLTAWERSDADRAFVPHEDMEPVFREAGYSGILGSLPSSQWTVWTPDSRDTPLYAYTPDLTAEADSQRERLAELLADAGVGTERFIDVLDGQKASFDTANYRDVDDPELSGNYGVKGGRGGDEGGLWLVDIDVDDYDEVKESNERVEDLRGETLGVASAHTTTDRPGHLYVAVRGDPVAVVRDYMGREVDNPAASFGEIRVKEQYVVGPGSEIVCCCRRCTDAEAADHYGRYELATERPPVVWTEEQFRDFLAADPAIQPGDSDSTGAGGDDANGTFTGDVSGRLAVAKKADSYVADALREATNPDDRSQADSALARAIGPWLGYDEDEIADVLDRHGTSKWANRGDSYRASVLDYATSRPVDAYDTVPYWAVVEYAVAEGIVDRDDLVERDSDTRDKVEDADTHAGDTYTALPDGDTYRKALEALDELGVDHGRDASPPKSSDAFDNDPREADVVLDARRAWDAAGRVTPADLDDDLPLDTTEDGEGWAAGDVTVDVVRAVAVGEFGHGAEDTLDADSYDRAYNHARDAYGAPLPEYVTAADAADRYDVVVGAVRALGFHDLDAEALTATVSEADEAGDVTHYIDPTPVDGWRDSDSGESVLVFDSGTVWDADTEETIDALRLVALDSGLIDDPTEPLEGGLFERAYRVAREDYRAPLPRWAIGTPEVEPVLPPAEDLAEAVPDSGDDLQDARDGVENLYRQLARGEGDADVSVLRALPGLGKTTSAIKSATEVPTAYLAPRKELQKDAAAKADKWGAAWEYLPVFGGGDISDAAVDAAVEAVRTDSQDLLRDRWALAGAIEEPLYPDEEGEDDEDTTDLNRPTCPTAEGDHGEAFALAIHTARRLDYTPRDIHERAEALFGSSLPCQDEGDAEECEYSAGWDRIADPDRPIDLLIGSYGHAHVESARTHYSLDDRGSTERTERAVVLDEFVGDAFAEEFGEEFVDHSVWAAASLRGDVTDRQDLFSADLWGDDWVRAWLRGDGAEAGEAADAHDALRNLAGIAEALNAVEDLADSYGGFIDTHDFAEPLEALRDAGADLDGARAGRIASDLRDRLDTVDGQRGGSVVAWLTEDVVEPLESFDGTDPVAALPEAVCGDLRAFVEDAVATARDRPTDAGGLLRAAATALEGGDAGCRELAVHADDGYAHRLAHRLLAGVIAPAGEDGVADVIETSAFNYSPEEYDGTRLKHVRVDAEAGTDTVLVDRNHEGATVLSPPSRTAGSGEECPVVGLDATARRRLWGLMLGADVGVEDIHDSMADRARFLRDGLGLQVVRTADKNRFYEGDPAGKDLDGDVALIEEINDEYAGVYAGGREEDAATVGSPAVITTKGVREVLETDERLDDKVAGWDNYGNITGDNDLGDHRLAAVLGCQHYGDHAVEKVAALAGEEVTRSGHGLGLSYDSAVANTYLQHMTEDQTMQAILRFTRGDSGAVVFARTAALRGDLPVVGEGQVVRSWSDTAADVARAWKARRGGRFTVADVADSVDVGKRQVRRILDEFASAGYLEKHDTGAGVANEFTSGQDPSAGEVELPGVDMNPDTSRKGTTYTGNVRVWTLEDGERRPPRPARSTLPAPEDADEVAPPG